MGRLLLPAWHCPAVSRAPRDRSQPFPHVPCPSTLPHLSFLKLPGFHLLSCGSKEVCKIRAVTFSGLGLRARLGCPSSQTGCFRRKCSFPSPPCFFFFAVIISFTSRVILFLPTSLFPLACQRSLPNHDITFPSITLEWEGCPPTEASAVG